MDYINRAKALLASDRYLDEDGLDDREKLTLGCMAMSMKSLDLLERIERRMKRFETILVSQWCDDEKAVSHEIDASDETFQDETDSDDDEETEDDSLEYEDAGLAADSDDST
jgi:hypothetical protein